MKITVKIGEIHQTPHRGFNINLKLNYIIFVVFHNLK